MTRVSTSTEVQVQRLPNGAGLDLPAYQTEGAAGMDIRAAIDASQPITMAPGGRALIPTGLAFAVPPGYELQVRPRSGLAHRHGITVLNAPGTVDSDYRGEVQVILINLGDQPFEITRGERIAQAVLVPVAKARIIEVEVLDATARSGDGFGSTGTG